MSNRNLRVERLCASATAIALSTFVLPAVAMAQQAAPAAAADQAIVAPRWMLRRPSSAAIR
jgi:invasion protein IalB